MSGESVSSSPCSAGGGQTGGGVSGGESSCGSPAGAVTASETTPGGGNLHLSPIPTSHSLPLDINTAAALHLPSWSLIADSTSGITQRKFTRS